MNIWGDETAMAVLSGIAGAAAMAATDWRSPWRLAQHLFVGTSASAIATPIFAPAISKVLGFVAVDPAAHENASAFLVGGFAIYFLEFALAVWRRKTKEGGDNA
jgi:hypothetical protein